MMASAASRNGTGTTTVESESPLFHRSDSKERGRHLVASRDLDKGRLLWVERPLLALQSLENRREVSVCACCYAFCGDANYALRKRFNRDFFMDAATVVPCRDSCGYLYCSKECEEDGWDGFHQYLCTGQCQEDHPLVLYKRFAVATNEILLLIAEWWVAEHTSQDSTLYADFCMEPWWDVATRELEHQPGGFAEALTLKATLETICQDAAELLRQALPSLPPITALDVARRIGACEQNAMGIRQRHPLCRGVFERSLREERHSEIVKCLAEAGFIGALDDDNDAANCCDDDDDNNPVADLNVTSEDTDEGWDYTVDEIAAYLANLYMDEDDSVLQAGETRKRDTTGDDLDYLFPPLDGTAMYATACKMNHSCDPNVIVRYAAMPGWGRHHPLVAFCVALKDVRKNEELTISYIERDDSLDKRQSSLANYGFECDCSRCLGDKSRECHTVDPCEVADTYDVFSAADESGDASSTEGGDAEELETSGEAMLQRRLERLDSVLNHCTMGGVPMLLISLASSFVLKYAANILSPSNDKLVEVRLKQCSDALQSRDLSMCLIAGSDLEEMLYSMLKNMAAWPNIGYRHAYWCAILAIAVALANRGSFVEAIRAIDKGLVFGLPRWERAIAKFIDFVEMHAAETACGPYRFVTSLLIPDYTLDELHGALSSPVQFPIEEVRGSLSEEKFRLQWSSVSKPVIIRHLLKGSMDHFTWRNLGSLAANYGHRLIPIERGSLLALGGIVEELMTIRDFVAGPMRTSLHARSWSLQDALMKSCDVAYLAQHPFLDQIPYLCSSLNKMELCGPDGPSHIHLWIGTGGTRTPLHFDSYDNMFVQVAGVKYVRLYARTETDKLYVGEKSSYGLQGNLSELNCECEDWTKHPKAREARYTEAVLYPGDCLFIPAWTWHYIRALTTSVSINYWF